MPMVDTMRQEQYWRELQEKKKREEEETVQQQAPTSPYAPVREEVEVIKKRAEERPKLVWKPPYVYQQIRKLAEQREKTAFRKYIRPGAKDPAVESIYFAAGAVKVVESYVRPEIKTASRAVVQEATRPKLPPPFEQIRVYGGQTPLQQYWKTVEEHPAEFAGELAGEYLMAKYVWGPILEKVGGGAKKGSEWVKRKLGISGPEAPTVGYYKEVIEEPAWQKALRLQAQRKAEWQARYRRTYQLFVESKAKGFVETTKLPMGVTTTPFSTSVQQVVSGPQVLLMETGQAAAEKTLPTASLKITPLVTQTVPKEATKIVYKEMTKTVAKTGLPLSTAKFVVPSLVRYGGPKFPSKFEMEKSWAEVSKVPELPPYPKPPTYKKREKETSKPDVTPETTPDITPTPYTPPKTTPDIEQTETVVEEVVEQPIIEQDLTQMQNVILGKPPIETFERPSRPTEIFEPPLPPHYRPETRKPKRKRRRKAIYDPLKLSRELWFYPVAPPKQFMKRVVRK